MKTTGRTTEGNYIVEMSHHEHRALSMLAEVLEGKELNYFHFHEPGVADLDLSTVLGAIWHFVNTKEMINQLKNKLQSIDDMLMDKKSEGDKLMEFFKSDK